jgi:hypothetical protein
MTFLFLNQGELVIEIPAKVGPVVETQVPTMLLFATDKV